MNWRGRICVVLGVLLLIGLPLWYFQPVWLYRYEASLDLHNAYVEEKLTVLTVPVWSSSQPTFVSEELGLDESNSLGQYLLLERSPPHLFPTGFVPVREKLSKIDLLLNKLEKLETRPERKGELRQQVAEAMAKVIRMADHPVTLSSMFGHLQKFLSGHLKAKTKPRHFRLFSPRKRPRPLHRDEMPDEPSYQSLESDNILSWEQTIHAPAPSVLNPCRSMRMIDLVEDALPKLPKDDSLPIIRQKAVNVP